MASEHGETAIMHFTHIENLPGIFRCGGLLADSRMRELGGPVKDCADAEIKSRRQGVVITVPPHGCVADYVPFYYAPRSPMLYRIHRGGVSTYPHGQEPLIYLVSSAEKALQGGIPWVGSDGNCAASMTRHFADWQDLQESIDWPLMSERMWNNTAEDGDRMRRRQAEFLVHEFFPLSCVTAIIAMSRDAATKVIGIVGSDLEVRVDRNWYY
ncbi:DUF4433 domain-containing protein [Saccharothrix longispora]|nr:DUF4433 domain-containing protein [Saccharothrix longispora]